MSDVLSAPRPWQTWWMQWISVPTPIGDMGVAAEHGEIVALRFTGAGGAPAVDDPEPVLRAAAEQIRAYFDGELTEFRLALAAPEGSGFDRAVWKAIGEIPYADMATYGEIAAAVGVPDAARAVGVACNRNPVPIIVGCHRVVGAGGKLVGFGGGLDRKRFLLQLEARVRIERDFL